MLTFANYHNTDEADQNVISLVFGHMLGTTMDSIIQLQEPLLLQCGFETFNLDICIIIMCSLVNISQTNRSYNAYTRSFSLKPGLNP